MSGARLRIGVVIFLAGATALACGSHPTPSEGTATSHETEKAPVVEAPQVVGATSPGVPRRLPGVARTKQQIEASPPPSNCTMIYHGGQILQNVNIVNVNWSSFVEPTVQTVLPQFWSALVASDWLPWQSEYGTAGRVGSDGKPGSNQGLLGAGTLQGSYTIAPSVCGDGTKCTVMDNEPAASDIATVLTQQIQSGALPQPEIGCDGYVKSLYTIQFPAAVTIELIIDGSGSDSCSDFCGYHYWFTLPAADGGPGLAVPYAVLPDMLSGPCKSACEFTKVPLDNYTSVSSHELAEAITDTTVTIKGNYVRPSAWGGNCGEVGDACENLADSGGSITTPDADGGTTTWHVQKIWSNDANNCVVTQPAPPLCAGQPGDPAGCRPCGCTDVGVGCSGGTPYCETNPANVDVGACVQCTATSGTCPKGFSCDQSTNPATDDTCGCGNASQPCCPGNQCTAPNTCGGGGTKDVCGCTPSATCAGKTCGTVDDGCGNVLDCGTCTLPQTCGGGGTPDVCGCTPAKTCPKGQTCGTAPDGCGGTLSCGSCTAPDTCGGGGTPDECGCTNHATCPAGANCGTVPDTCTGTISCGPACSAPATCGGGGTPNVCGCDVLKVCPTGKNCGTLSDHCGGQLNCGTCAAPDSCGGGGEANVCGCAKLAACPGTDQCGTISDGCGGTLTCGSCSGGATCVGNQCVGGATPDAGTVDSGTPVADSGTPGVDSGTPVADASAGTPDAGEPSSTPSNGCGCRTVDTSRSSTTPALLGVLALLGGLRLRRRRGGRGEGSRASPRG